MVLMMDMYPQVGGKDMGLTGIHTAGPKIGEANFQLLGHSARSLLSCLQLTVSLVTMAPPLLWN